MSPAMEALKPPAQKRSREAMGRIYAAANRLLETKTFDQIAVAEIAERAGVSVGSIYQRFPSKDALLWAMYAQYLDEAVPRALHLAQSAFDRRLDARVRAVIELVIDLFAAHRGIVRSLLVRYRHDASQVPETFRARFDEVSTALARFIAQSDAKISTPKSQEALDLLMAGCRERILFAQRQSPRADPAYARFLTAAILGALGAGAPR